MRRHRNLALLIVVGCVGVVLAQTVEPLPKKLSGRWTVVVPGGQTYTDTMSVVLDVPDGVGPVTGRFTSRGVGCGSQDEPLVGTWDGNQLRFETLARPNVNVQRMNADCGTGRLTVVLTRKSGQSTFEGESRRDGVPTPAQVTLAP